MAKNIQDLRREAGYKSAKDFAAAMGIPASTYNRYESQPDAIPLRQAWAIADFLGCSIDMVVGREPVSAEDMRGDVQKFYDGLGAESRRLMDDHMDYLAHREKRAAKRAERAVKVHYSSLLTHYKSLFDERRESAEPFGTVVTFSAGEYRSAFQHYLESLASRKRVTDPEKTPEGFVVQSRDNLPDAEGTIHAPTDAEKGTKLEMEPHHTSISYTPQDREVIDGIMRAYDERDEEGGGDWRAYVRSLK